MATSVPAVEHKGNRDLWTNMPMLWCLQSYYEYSKDPRVIPFMTKYFQFQLALPDNKLIGRLLGKQPRRR
jgi:hypothetical protein